MRVLGAVAILLPAVAALADGDPPAARVGTRTIAVTAVDARCGLPCSRLKEQIRARKWATLAAIADEALLQGLPAPAPAPVTDAEVEAFVAAHAQDFHGPPARDRAAVRFYLECERRRAQEAARAADERRRRPPRMLTQPDDPALAERRPERTLAEVDGTPIRDAAVEERLALELHRLRGALHRDRRRHLDALIDESLWEEAAAERAMPAAELRAQVRSSVAPVTDADIDAYLEGRTKETDARPDRVRPYLEFLRTQAAEDELLAAQRRRAATTILLSEPEAPRLHLGPGPGGWRGPADAPVKVVFLTSYRGATSRAMWRVVRTLADEPGTALAVRPLLPQWDPEAMAVAAAVRCAGEAGRAWELHEAAAGHDTLPDAETLGAMAAAAGIERDPFAACLERQGTAEAVAAASAEAERLGLTEPPAVLVNGRVFGGMQGIERLRAAVQEARAALARVGRRQ